jgi:hypothetical protein
LICFIIVPTETASSNVHKRPMPVSCKGVYMTRNLLKKHSL